MKTLFTILLSLFFYTNIGAQAPTISTNRLGELIIGAKLDSINLFVDKKIVFSPLKEENNYSYDTVYTSYKHLPIRLVLNRYQEYDETKTNKKIEACILTSIYTENKSITTKSGIKIGDNKFDIIKKVDGNRLSIYTDDYEHPKSTRYSVIRLYDEKSGNCLVFYFLDNSLYALENSFAEEGD